MIAGVQLNMGLRDNTEGHVEITTATASPNGKYLVEGIQLRNRKLVPKRLGDFILWAFFHRKGTFTSVVLSGFSQKYNPKLHRSNAPWQR